MQKNESMSEKGGTVQRRVGFETNPGFKAGEALCVFDLQFLHLKKGG